VVVTGGGRGLGWEMADALVQTGHRVLITGARASAELEQACARWNQGRSTVVAAWRLADVAQWSDCQAVAAQCTDTFGQIDGLVNNAGRGMREISEEFNRKPALFWQADPQGFRNTNLLEANGWKMLIPAEGFPTNATDLSPHITKLKGTTPGIFAFAGLPEGTAKVMKELRRQGHNSTLIGGQIFADPDIGKILGPDGEGATYVAWYWWDVNAKTRDFEKKFLDEAKKRGVNKSGAHHVDASAYDIVYVFADAMKRTGATGDATKVKAERTAIRDALATTNIDGVIGKICFSKDNDSQLPAYIIRIKDGQRTLLGSHPPEKCS